MSSTTTPATYPAPPIEHDGDWFDLDPAAFHGGKGLSLGLKTPEEIAHDNRVRASWAYPALGAYRTDTDHELADPDIAIASLLSDLHHLADALGVDFEDARAKATRYYTAEILGDA